VSQIFFQVQKFLVQLIDEYAPYVDERGFCY